MWMNRTQLMNTANAALNKLPEASNYIVEAASSVISTSNNNTCEYSNDQQRQQNQQTILLYAAVGLLVLYGGISICKSIFHCICPPKTDLTDHALRKIQSQVNCNTQL